jgi:chloramphenicol 3-O-phosphotransferase
MRASGTLNRAFAAPLVVLVGASGAGKTAIANAIERRRPKLADVAYFDRIGVPTPAAMVAGWGSGEAWQRAATLEWMARLGELRDRQTPFLFEGQTRFSFVEEGLRFAGIDNARIILVDCDDAVRSRRLRRERGQPALANPTMMNWAETLRREARLGEYDILDTSTLTLDQSVDRVRAYFAD